MRTIGALLLTVVSALALTTSAGRASAPPLGSAEQLFGGESTANTIITTADGGAVVGCGNSVSLRMVSPSGQITATVPGAPLSPLPSVCGAQSAVDRSGVVYSAASDSGGSFIVAYRGEQRQWVYPAMCPVIALRVGVDDNVYAVLGGGSCSQPRLVGVKPTLAAGQTTPVQVMDESLDGLDVPRGGLAAYSAGLVVQTWSGLRFVGYDGTFIRTVAVANLPGQTASFDATPTGMAYVAVRADQATRLLCHDDNAVESVRAIDPSQDRWSHTLPQCSRVTAIRPVPSGGVIVQMSTPSGNDRQETLRAITASGGTDWERALPEVDPADNQVVYTRTSYAVDLGGAVIIQRTFTRYSATDGKRWPGIQLVRLNAAGSVASQYEFGGDPADDSDAGLGYGLTGGQVAIGRDTVYVLANRCTTTGQCHGDLTLYPVKSTGLQIDYPRGYLLGLGGPIVPMPQPAVRTYVALGDSFSSGEGVAPFEAATDVPDKQSADYNLCHRSTRAYARLLAADKGLRLNIPTRGFRACSGAVSARITTAWPDKSVDGKNGPNRKEPPQIDVLDASTDVVTLTMSGNDIHFSDFASRCVLADCSKHRKEFVDRIAALDRALRDVYEEILGKAPNAHAYVMGYPQLLPDKRCTRPGMTLIDTAVRSLVDSFGVRREALPVAAGIVRQKLADMDIHLSSAEAVQLLRHPDIQFTDAERTLARDLVNKLDAKIKQIVTRVDAGRGRITYVNPQSTFTGHELCTSQSYFNGLVVNPARVTHDLPYSFHPNAFGQQAYYRALRPKLAP